MQYENPIQMGYTRNIDVNLGAGLDTNLTYVSSNPELLSVDAAGVVTPLVEPTKVTRVVIAAKDAHGVVRASFSFDVLPTGHVIDSRYDLVNIGNAAYDMKPMPFYISATIGDAVADEPAV